MAWRKGHLWNIGDIPSTDNQTSRIGIGPYLLLDVSDLIDALAVRALPRPPLLAINRPQFAIVIGPLIPNRYPVLLEIRDVGFPFEEPKEFVSDTSKVDLFGGQQWKTIG